MRVGIVGGGISGLYIANKLCDSCEVTIFEGGTWGGDIRHVNVEGTCYPVSTIVVMPGNDILKQELRRIVTQTVDVFPFHRILILLLGLVVLPVALACTLGCTTWLARTVAAIVVVFAVVTLVRSILRSLCGLILAFGANNRCYLPQDYVTKTSWRDMWAIMQRFQVLIDCGFSKLAQSYLHTPKVTYVNEPVLHIDRKSTSIHTAGAARTFDKIIIACPYHSYSKILPLDPAEQVLSQNEYFEFYSTLVKFQDRNVDLRAVRNAGMFQLKDAYLIASHAPLAKLPDYAFKKEFKWNMLT